MATEAEIQSKIQALEDELANQAGAVDFSSSGGGAALSVSQTAASRRELRAELKFWRRRLWAVQGGKAAEPAAVGVDIERETSNRDEIG